MQGVRGALGFSGNEHGWEMLGRRPSQDGPLSRKLIWKQGISQDFFRHHEPQPLGTGGCRAEQSESRSKPAVEDLVVGFTLVVGDRAE